MAASGTLAIRIVGDVADFVGRMGTAQKALISLGTGVGTAGIAALRMGDNYDKAADSIRTATGKTGAALAGLEQSFKNVAGRVKEDIGLTSAVLGELHSRTGLTGQGLEDLTVRVIEFSRVTGTDAVANTALVTRLFGDWSVATGDQAEVMDKLLRASQATGLGVDALMQTVVQFGAPLRLLGFSMEESIALLGKWEKEGVNVEAVLGGMKIGLGNLAAQGVPANQMAATFRERLEAIKTSGTPAADAIKLFGKRAGPDLAAAILEGRFSVDDLVKAIEDGSETVRDAAADTRDFGDGFAELKNKIATAMGPIMADFAGLADAMGPAIYLLPAIGGAIGGVTAKLWLKVAALAAASGGWKAMLLSMGPMALGGAAVAGGLVLINEGLNIAAEKMRAFSAGLRELDAVQRENLRTQEVFGMQIGAVTDHFANFLGIVAPWHQVATDAATATDTLNGRFVELGRGLKGTAEQVVVLPEATHRAAMGVDDDIGLMETSFERLPPVIGAAGAESVEVFRARMIELHQVAAWAGATTPGEFSQGLRSSFDNIRTAFTDLKDLMRNTLSPAKEEAYLEGVATSRRLARGLADERPAVRTEAQQIALDTIAKLRELNPASAEIGRLTTLLLANALPTEKPALRDAINGIVAVVTTPIDNMRDNAHTWGDQIGSRFVGGIKAALAQGYKSTKDAFLDYKSLIATNSPPPPGNVFYGVGHWGESIADTFVGGMTGRLRRGTGEISATLGRIGAQAAGAMRQPGMPLTLAGAAAGATGGGGYAGPPITVNAYGQDDVEGQIRRALRRVQIRKGLGGFGDENL